MATELTQVAQLLIRFETMGQERVAAATAQMKELDATARTSGASLDSSLTKTTTASAGMEAAATRAARKVSTLGLEIGGLATVVDVLSAKAAGQFQASMELIHTQAGASQQEVDGLTQSVLDLSGQVATAPDQLAASLYHVESAGFRSAQALEITKAAAMGAKVGHADLEAVTQSLVAVTASHIKGVESETQAMGILNGIVGAGDMRMQQLADAMSTGVVESAKTFGLSIQDVGAALATLGDNLQQGSEAGTRLRMTLALMAAPSGPAAKALKEIGLSATQLAVDMRKPQGLLVALQDLKTHLEEYEKGLMKAGATAAQAQAQGAEALSKAFGGGKSSGVLLTLLDQMDRLKSKYAEVQKGANDFAGAWTATQKTVSYEWDQLTSTFQRLAITTGDIVMPEVQALGSGLQGLATGAEHLESVAPGLVTGLSAAALTIGGVSLALKAGIAIWEPYSAVMRLFAGSTAATAGSTLALSGTQTAAVRSTALVDAAMTKWAGTLLSTDELIAALDVELAATGPEAVAAGGAMDTAAAGTGALAGAVDLLMGPVGIIALGVALGVIAFEKSPAFRAEIGKAADALEVKLATAADIAGKHLSDLGAVMDKIGSKLGGKGNSGAGFLEGIANAGLYGVGLGSLPSIGSGLDSIHQKQEANNQQLSAARDAVSLVNAQYQQQYGLQEQINGKIRERATLEGTGKAFDTGTKNATASVKLDTSALAGAILHKNDAAQQEFLAAAVRDSVGLKAHTDSLQESKDRVARATGDWTAVLQSEGNKDQQAYDQARARIVLTLAQHGTVTSQMIADVKRTGTAIAGLGKSGDQADKIIKSLFGGQLPGFAKNLDTATQKLQDFASTLSQAASKSFDKAAAAAFQGKANSGSLFDIAVEKAGKNSDFTQFTASFKLKVDKAAGDWGATIGDMRTVLQSAVDYWQGKLLHDQGPGGDKGAIAGDKSHLTGAEKQLQSFNTEIDKTKNKTKNLGDAFQRASTSADKTLKAWVLGSLDGAKNLGVLKDKALSAAEANAKLQDRMTAYAQWLDHQIHPLSSSDKSNNRQQQLQTTYDNEVAQGAREIRTLGHETQATKDKIAEAHRQLDAFNKSLKAAAYKPPPKQDFASVLGRDEKSASKWLDKWDSATLHGAQNAEELGKKAIDAAKVVVRMNAIHDKHTQMIQAATLVVGKFSDVLSVLAQKVSDTTSVLAGLIYKGQDSRVVGGAHRTTASGQDVGGLTAGQVAQNKATAAYLDHQKAVKDDEEATYRVAKQAGDFGTVMKITGDRIQRAWDAASASINATLFGGGTPTPAQIAALNPVADQREKQASSDRGTANYQAQADIDAAARAGDLGRHFDLLGQHLQAVSDYDLSALGDAFLTGKGDLDQLTTSAKNDKAALDAHAAASWDASFAIASAAEKSQMLTSKFQPLISQFDTLSQMKSSEQQGQLQVLADIGTQQLDALKSIQTSIDDETAVLSSEANVTLASGAGLLAAVRDQGAIIQARGAIDQANSDLAKATTDQERQAALAARRVGEDQLQIARETFAMNQSQAGFDRTIAEQQLVIDRDKQAADKEAASWTQRIDSIKVQLSEADLVLTKAQNQLQIDELGTLLDLRDIFATFAGVSIPEEVTRFGNRISDDLGAIGSAQDRVATLTGSLQDTTQHAALSAQDWANKIAADQQQLSIDQSNKSLDSQSWNMRLAQDTNQLQRDEVLAAQQTANNTTKLVQLTSQQVQSLGDLMVKFANALTARARSNGGPSANGAFVPWINHIPAESWAS